jgi:hypothetical protein
VSILKLSDQDGGYTLLSHHWPSSILQLPSITHQSRQHFQ